MTGSPPLCRLRIDAPAGDPRRGEPLAFGVPFARGAVVDTSRLVVVDALGKVAPTAARPVESWSDGSVRWAFVETVLDVDGPSFCDVRIATPASVPWALDVQPDGRRVAVSTAGVDVHFDADVPGGVAGAFVAGLSVLDPASTGVRLRVPGGALMPLSATAVDVEHVSALRARVLVSAVASLGDARVNIRLGFNFFAGVATIGVDIDLHNPRRAEHPGGFWELGDPGSLSLELAQFTLGLAPVGLPALVVDVEGADDLRPMSVPFSLWQESSGGEHWNSPVHVTRDGTLPFAHCGYRLRDGDRESEGRRASPTVVVERGEARLSVTAPRFWQVFPKAIALDADGVLRIDVLPAGAGPHELQGGERCHFAFAVGLGAETVSSAPLRWRRCPTAVWPRVDDAIASAIAPGLAEAGAPDAYEHYLAAAIEGDESFVAKRERIDEYGWRHYGDLYADHENGLVAGTRRVSHYNNQYDALAGLLLQSLRTGDNRWMTLADDLAAHVAHIDIYWTTEDKAAYNGGLFWHTVHYIDAGRSTHRSYPNVPEAGGGGPANEHCYSSGFLLHYLLTGAPASRDAVLSLGEWVLAMDDGDRAPWVLRLLSRAPTGAATATYSVDYHGPGRGAGNALTAVLNAYRLTRDARFLGKAHEIVARVVHPLDDVAARGLDQPEARWSYTVMLMALGAYITVLDELGRCQAERQYARAALLRYARWMAEHEYPYLDKPERLEFPTETWAAQDMRKSDVFDLAAALAETADERARFLERAAFFHESSVGTLRGMATGRRTRPLVLLLSCGYARHVHASRLASAPLEPPCPTAWPAPSRFVPQRLEARARAVRLALAAVLLGVAGLAAIVAW